VNDYAEWLEADGLGGFASGTAAGIRTRRYHALLLVATTPPTGRYVLVNGFDAWAETGAGSFPLSSQRYEPDVVHPDGWRRIETFASDPWPRWVFRLEDGTRIEQEIVVLRDLPAVVASWRLLEGSERVTLNVRPLLSGRDYHSLQHENPAFRFDAEVQAEQVVWHPYADLPPVRSIANAEYGHQPDWYRNFLYSQERARGLDCREDLASPGVLRWDLARSAAYWLLTTDLTLAGGAVRGGVAVQAAALRDGERARRERFPSRLQRSADAYIVRRGDGKSIVAGYPWFTDWGRDTFISLRGLCLATGRLEEARDILLRWAATVSQGMLPNLFTDHGEAPEFNSVDASLWYVIAVSELLRAGTSRWNGERKRSPNATIAGSDIVSAEQRQTLLQAVDAILTGYAGGTRYGIRADADGLLAAGETGVQLTWMDAKVGDWVVTPRIGKPVEVQALWLNALAIGAERSKRWRDLLGRGRAAFERRFWNETGGCLYDVVDVEHRPGTADAAFRPNQIFAAGGLPLALVEGERARQVVDAVEERLWTPLGLRSLAPGEPGYSGRYEGGVHDRDAAYHQGTVWPWLLGPFADAWLRVRGNTAAAKNEARRRFVQPLIEHLDQAGLGHVSEITDGDPPHNPRGCPFQAWSVGELLRLDLVTLAEVQSRALRTPIEGHAPS
jgi:glycogen debranching enzyme